MAGICVSQHPASSSKHFGCWISIFCPGTNIWSQRSNFWPKRMYDNSSECRKEERIGIISHRWQGFGWVSGEKVEESASLSLISSAISVFGLHSPSHMNFISPHQTQSIAPFHRRGNRNPRRKYLTDIQRKWQELGSALSPPSITVPLPRTRLSKRKRGLPSPGGDIPQALAGGWKYSPTGDLPNIKASFQTTVLESAELSSEQVALVKKLSHHMNDIFYICI